MDKRGIFVGQIHEIRDLIANCVPEWRTRAIKSPTKTPISVNVLDRGLHNIIGFCCIRWNTKVPIQKAYFDRDLEINFKC